MSRVCIDFAMSSRRLTVPALAAGTYRLCWARGEDLARLGAPLDGCATGSLDAGGALTLRLDPRADR